MIRSSWSRAPVYHGPGSHVLRRDRVGARRVMAVFCLMLDLEKPQDLARARGLQDAIWIDRRLRPAGPHWSAYQAPIALCGAARARLQAAFRTLASYVALGCQAGTVIILAIAAIEALALLVRAAPRLGDQMLKKRIWVRFASWIVISLEFALAADIVGTAISPTWNDIGQLAAIAAIRTGLNFFLTRDIESVSHGDLGPPPDAARSPA